MEDSELTYSKAIEELRQILQDLQGDLEDIDQLEKKMKRARFLLHYCHKKLKDVNTSIEQIVEEMEQEAEGGNEPE
ncbi:MAG: exodeoxyribonuclease VII small subunit [Saprospirales bacterium]|nr:MAG: exodeoxyribonuclease VII small subunit [Saprospirales bacterium]